VFDHTHIYVEKIEKSKSRIYYDKWNILLEYIMIMLNVNREKSDKNVSNISSSNFEALEALNLL
jgi:hypothetical protein